MEKQIKEIAGIIFQKVNGANFDDVSDAAVAIYRANYRKQSEGEWLCIYLNKFEHLSKHKCSECGFVNTTRYNYCPNCGAKMKGAEHGKED